jgi:hypothetical protein
LLPFIELLEIKILLLYNIIPQKKAYSHNKKKCIKPVRLFYLFRRIKSKYTIGDDQYGTMHKEYTEKTHVGIREKSIGRIHAICIVSKSFYNLLRGIKSNLVALFPPYFTPIIKIST